MQSTSSKIIFCPNRRAADNQSTIEPLTTLSDLRLGIIGLGYVGLPLAVEFGKTRSVPGFDINPKRIGELSKGHDLRSTRV